MEIKRIGAVVRGRVQGVGFRYFTRDRAQACSLTGWVQNMPDGAVELEAQGAVKILDDFTAEIKTGPSFSHVSEVTINELPVEEREKGFEIRF
jgi:acylphosphatase